MYVNMVRMTAEAISNFNWSIFIIDSPIKIVIAGLIKAMILAVLTLGIMREQE